MFSPGDQLKSALGLGGLISIYGIVSVIVWFLGPAYGFEYAEQIILIALLLATAPFAFIISRRLTTRSERREAEAEAAAQTPQGDGEQPSGQPADSTKARTPAATQHPHRELANAAAEVVHWLRANAPGAAAAATAPTRSGRVLNKLRALWHGDALKEQDPIYRMPWFVVAGPPQSGKSSLVISSGLNFQPVQGLNQTQSNLSALRDTTSCEWRISDSAVVLDTAGRYQTEGVPHRAEWQALVEILKKNRALRPLDGLLVAVDASRIAGAELSEVETTAKILRGHLNELMKSVGMEFPVYLIFTHADAVEGFEDFFATLGHDERTQVWGATIWLNEVRPVSTLFDEEFDQLLDVLLRRRLARLGSGARADEQLRIFNFPLLFGRPRRNLAHFTSVLFSPRSATNQKPLLRGFYFTASPATQKGGPARPAPVPRAKGDGGAVRTVRDSYFTATLFDKVLLPDRNLTAARHAHRVRPERLRLALLAAATLLLLALALGVVTSFVGNRRLIREASLMGSRVESANASRRGRPRDLASQETAAARLEIEALDGLRRTLGSLDEYERDTPLSLGFGLYSGNAINPQLRNIYFEAVTQRFYKPAVAALESDLRAFVSGTVPAGTAAAGAPAGASGSDAANAAAEAHLERHYDLLKAYLMLADGSKVDDPKFLADKLSPYWRKASPPEVEAVAKSQLDFFAEQAGRADAPHLKVDDDLIRGARRKLAAEYPAVNRYYKRVTSEINRKINSNVTVAGIVGVRGGEVISGSHDVPGSFTIEGYREHMREAIESAPEDIGKEDWVMGGEAVGESRNVDPDIQGKLRRMYFIEYADQWRSFLTGIRVRDFDNRDDAVKVLTALQESQSPMNRLMLEVARQTNLSAPPTGGFFRRLWSRITAGGAYSDTGGGSEVEKEFRPLFDFVNDQSGASKLSEYGNKTRAVLDQMPANEEQLRKVSNQFLTGEIDGGLPRAIKDVESLLGSLEATTAGKDAAGALRQPLDKLREMLNVGGFESIAKIWREQIYPLARKAEFGYPFTDTGEASRRELANFFNPKSGQFTKFFNERLAASFEDVEGRWQVKSSSAFHERFSSEFLDYLNRARRLREALFSGGGDTPEVEYHFTLKPMTGAEVIVEIDGQTVKTQGVSAESKRFTWPTTSGQTGARIKVVRLASSSNAAGGVPTPPATPPAGSTSELPPFTGDWGVFKMFEAGLKERSGDGHFLLSWRVGSTNVSATLRPGSPNNHPFRRELFRELRAPEKLEK